MGGGRAGTGSTVTFEDQGNPASWVGFAFFDPAFGIAGREGESLSIAPLPNEDGQACCPTTIDAWAGEGFEQSWALYAVPDGLIAATSVQRNGEGPPDVVVPRTGAAHRGAGYFPASEPVPYRRSCRAAELWPLMSSGGPPAGHLATHEPRNGGRTRRVVSGPARASAAPCSGQLSRPGALRSADHPGQRRPRPGARALACVPRAARGARRLAAGVRAGRARSVHHLRRLRARLLGGPVPPLRRQRPRRGAPLAIAGVRPQLYCAPAAISCRPPYSSIPAFPTSFRLRGPLFIRRDLRGSAWERVNHAVVRR